MEISINTDAYRVDSERDLKLRIFKPGSVYVYWLYTPVNYFKCVMLPVVKMWNRFISKGIEFCLVSRIIYESSFTIPIILLIAAEIKSKWYFYRFCYLK